MVQVYASPPVGNQTRPAGMLRRLFLLALLCLSVQLGFAQAPSSLSYPPTNSYLTGKDAVYLAPNVAGNVSSYSISPALPTGLSLNPNTGVITGVASQITGITTYTVTATNSSGSTTSTFTLQTPSSGYNNNNGTVKFLDANRTFKVGTTGQAAGDVAVYSNVVTINGVALDCIVKTVAVNNVTSWDAYDQSQPTGTNFNSNSDDYFSPQVRFGTGGGSVRFDFQYILGGTYVSAANPGTNVILQNVRLNTYDIDGNNGGGSKQYNEFGGFRTYELNNGVSNINATYNTTTNLTRFESKSDSNASVVTNPINRIRVNYDEMSAFSIVIGAGAVNQAFFFLDFSPGGSFTTVTYAPPTVVLNTATTGVNNGKVTCVNPVRFTEPNQSGNASAGQNNPNDPKEFTLQFPSTDIQNAASELLAFGTGSTNIPLNFANNASFTRTIGGVAYTITGTVANGISKLTFVNGASTFTIANAEALLDSLQYQNTAATPILGKRNFTVSLRNDIAKSPDAIFTADINCAVVSGNIYHDANGLSDNIVNANATALPNFAVPMYAVLTDTTGRAVRNSVTVAAGSTAYSFGNVEPGMMYNLYFRTAAVTSNTTVTSSTYPAIATPYAATYVSSGENLGAGAGNDGLADGKIRVTIGVQNATNINFGLQIPPNATANTQAANLNPGGFNYQAVTGTAFGTSDADGTVDSIVITTFPTNTNALRIGSTIYTTAGSTCPPQSSCIPFPASGGVAVPYSGGAPATGYTISVDPSVASGATSVDISYRAKDNGRALSTNTATVNVPFSDNSGITVGGNVWDDANASGVKDAGEVFTNAANSGQTLYALLVQTSNTYSGNPTILNSVAVSSVATGATYSFSNVPRNNNYEVRIASLATQPDNGALFVPASQVLATGYVGVSYNANGTATSFQNTSTPVISLGGLTASQTSLNFGIEQKPVSAAYTVTRQANPGGTIQVPVPTAAFRATDVEDNAGAAYPNNLSGRTVTLVSTVANTVYYNNGGTITAIPVGGATFSNFNPANVTIDPAAANGPETVTFTYSVNDNAGIGSSPTTITVPFDAPLAISGSVWNDANGNAFKDGSEGFTNAGGLNAVLTGTDGSVLEVVAVSTGTATTGGTYSFTKATSNTNYRVVLSTTSPAIGSVLTAASLPAPGTGAYVNTGVNTGTVTANTNASTANKTGILTVLVSSTAVSNQNFGIEQKPIADAKSLTAPATSFTRSTGATPVQIGGADAYYINANSTNLSGAAIKSLSGTDVEDCATASSCTNNRSYLISTIKSNTRLFYGTSVGTATEVLAGNTIPNFTIGNLYVYGQQGQGNTPTNALGFTYKLVDVASVPSDSASYTLQSSSTSLAVQLLAFNGTVSNCEATLNWTMANADAGDRYEIQHSTTADRFTTVAEVINPTPAATAVFNSAVALKEGMNYLRLKMSDKGGLVSYSQVLTLQSRCNNSPATDLRLYPNPSTASFAILGLTEASTVDIMDATGRLLRQEKGIVASQQIDIESLPAGSYLIRISGTAAPKANLMLIKR
ncbi:MAG: T9SS type A sorting domain-containing protein [Sphingobacteriales bacterium]|nr:MAG: T9SS type A sorting domain-containing protein [Sphingobacteriales bacterium]